MGLVGGVEGRAGVRTRSWAGNRGFAGLRVVDRGKPGRLGQTGGFAGLRVVDRGKPGRLGQTGGFAGLRVVDRGEPGRGFGVMCVLVFCGVGSWCRCLLGCCRLGRVVVGCWGGWCRLWSVGFCGRW